MSQVEDAVLVSSYNDAVLVSSYHAADYLPPTIPVDTSGADGVVEMRENIDALKRQVNDAQIFVSILIGIICIMWCLMWMVLNS